MCGPVQDVSRQMKGWNADLTNGDVGPVSGQIFAPSWPLTFLASQLFPNLLQYCNKNTITDGGSIHLHILIQFKMSLMKKDADMLTCLMETEFPRQTFAFTCWPLHSRLKTYAAKRRRRHLISQISWRAAHERHTLKWSQTYVLSCPVLSCCKDTTPIVWHITLIFGLKP